MDVPPVQYVTTSDGYDIAYTVTGRGRPLVLMPGRLSHIQRHWAHPASAPWHQGLSERFRLIRYDHRGHGMSTRGLQKGTSLADFETDLDALVTHLSLERFVLMAQGPTSHVGIRYAASHLHSVEAMVLVHASARTTGLGDLLGRDLAQHNWELFLETVVASPAWTREERLSGVEVMKEACTQADWLTSWPAFSDSDVTSFLPRLSMPVLILHARQYTRLGLEESAHLAALLPNARLTQIDGASHNGDAVSGIKAIEAFLADLPEAASATTGPHLSEREVEVLRLLAIGKSNQQIADELVISLNTVRRHVSNIFDKTGVRNRAQAAVYARDRGIM